MGVGCFGLLGWKTNYIRPRSLTCWADQRTRRSRTGCSGRRNRRAPGPEPSTRAVTRQRLGKRRWRSRHVSARWHLALPPDGIHGLSRNVVDVCSAAPVPGSTATRRWRRRRSMWCGYLEHCRKKKFKNINYKYGETRSRLNVRLKSTLLKTGGGS